MDMCYRCADISHILSHGSDLDYITLEMKLTIAWQVIAE